MTGEKFICDNCEHKQLAFGKVHTKMHTIVRVSEKVEKKEVSTEERLQIVEDKLEKMMQLLARLVEKGMEGSPSDPFTKGDVQVAVIETESAQPVTEEEAGTTENS